MDLWLAAILAAAEMKEALFESYKKEVISECKEIDGKTITVDENGDWDID